MGSLLTPHRRKMILNSISLISNSKTSISVGDEYLENMFVRGEHIFLVDNDASIIQIVDISNSKFSLRGKYKYKSEDFYSLSVVDECAYIAGGESGIEILDISDTNNPVLQKRVKIPAFSIDVSANGKYLYAKDNISYASSFAINVLKIQEDGGLVLVNTVSIPEHSDFAIKDGVIYYLED
ncbi:MAG: hypothetical protein ACK5V6_11350 [Pseudanabaena sp.]